MKSFVKMTARVMATAMAFVLLTTSPVIAAQPTPVTTPVPTAEPAVSDSLETQVYRWDTSPYYRMGSISVSGTGTVQADPDMATLNVGVKTLAETASESQQQNAEIMEKIMAALKKLGVKDKEIQTSTYYMYMEYEYSYDYTTGKQEQKELGYQVTHLLTITVNDLENIGKILDAAVEAGANQTNGINFTVVDQETLYLEALELAMKSAQLKANAIAKSMNITLGAPTSVYENSYYNSGYYYSDSSVRSYANYSGGVSYETGISAGKIEITANVSLTYEYDR